MNNTVNVNIEYYALWDSLTEQPLKKTDGTYHYKTLDDLFNDFTNRKIPPYTEPRKIKNLYQNWQIKIADAIQSKKYKDALTKYFGL